jgi:hypothetical protein
MNLSDLEENHNKLYWLMSWVKYALLTDQEFEKLDDEANIKKFGSSLWNYSIERERIIPIHAQKLSMFMVSH